VPFRFWRRLRIAPGVTLNLSKSGASVSLGRRGAHLTMGPRGRRATVGIPGTGLFWSRRLDDRPGSPGRIGGPGSQQSNEVTERMDLDWFFRHLVPSQQDKAFIDACRELSQNNEDAAATYLEQALHLTDGRFLAGLVALSQDRPTDAAVHLEEVLSRPDELGRTFREYGLDIHMQLPITEEVDATITCDRRGTLLALVEAYQRLKRWDDAITALEQLRRLEPDDVDVQVSLADVLLEAWPEDRTVLRRVVALGEGMANESPMHAALLLYRGRALRALGLHEAALQVLTTALRRRKDRPADLLHALRYERALLLEEMGRRRRARAELERIYAEAPDYADVARRLGV